MYPVCSKGNFYYIKFRDLKVPRQEACCDGKYRVVLVVNCDYALAM
jgi:hypothetical protein